MVSTRLVNHQKDTHLQQVYDFYAGFVQDRAFGFYFDSGGDVQSRLQSNLSADVQSRHYDELVHDTATSSDVTPSGQGCALG